MTDFYIGFLDFSAMFHCWVSHVRGEIPPSGFWEYLSDPWVFMNRKY